MKTFEIMCIIFDKQDPSNENDQIAEIILNTIIHAESIDLVPDMIHQLYRVKEIISIQEIL